MSATDAGYKLPFGTSALDTTAFSLKLRPLKDGTYTWTVLYNGHWVASLGGFPDIGSARLAAHGWVLDYIERSEAERSEREGLERETVIEDFDPEFAAKPAKPAKPAPGKTRKKQGPTK